MRKTAIAAGTLMTLATAATVAVAIEFSKALMILTITILIVIMLTLSGKGAREKVKIKSRGENVTMQFTDTTVNFSGSVTEKLKKKDPSVPRTTSIDVSFPVKIADAGATVAKGKFKEDEFARTGQTGSLTTLLQTMFRDLGPNEGGKAAFVPGDFELTSVKQSGKASVDKQKFTNYKARLTLRFRGFQHVQGGKREMNGKVTVRGKGERIF